MKKILALLLVLGMATMAQATVVDIKKADFGDMGNGHGRRSSGDRRENSTETRVGPQPIYGLPVLRWILPL
jgi:hypothetical protein